MMTVALVAYLLLLPADFALSYYFGHRLYRFLRKKLHRED
jgi:hypothetical protein